MVHPRSLLPENRAIAAEETERAGGGVAKLSWPTGALLCFGRMADCCELVVGCQVQRVALLSILICHPLQHFQRVK